MDERSSAQATHSFMVPIVEPIQRISETTQRREFRMECQDCNLFLGYDVLVAGAVFTRRVLTTTQKPTKYGAIPPGGYVLSDSPVVKAGLFTS
jgi:hypothetical protein